MDIFEFSEDTKLSDLIHFKAAAFLPFLRSQLCSVSSLCDQAKAETKQFMYGFSVKEMYQFLDEWQPSSPELAECDDSLVEYNVMVFFARYGLLDVFVRMVEDAIRAAEGEQ